MLVACISCLGALLCVALPASAQEPLADRASEILPPAPDERVPVRGIEVRVIQPIPLYARPLCPEPHPCIFGVGGGFGVTVERRYTSGIGFGVGSELWFATAESVYELPTVVSVGPELRYVLMPERGGHLSLMGGAGLVALGDIFRLETLGPYVQVGLGGELEMSESLAFTLGMRTSAMTFIPFTTREDDVRRSVHPFVDVVTTLHVGILWLAPRARAR